MKAKRAIRISVVLLAHLFAAGVLLAAAPTTQPTAAETELAAMTAFNKGDFAQALPLLKKVADTLADKPDRLSAVQERIRVCERQLASATPADTTSATQDPPSDPKTRKAHVKPKDGDTLDLAIKELGNFPYDPKVGGLPDDVSKLNGIKIRTRGYMVPLDQADNITEFALVPSLFACCQFGQAPQVQHTIVIHAPKGKSVNYYPDEITVEGTLKVEEKKDDDYVVSLFEIDCTSVKPSPKQ